MKSIAIVGFAVMLMGGAPQEEQTWLKQLAGEWEVETEATLEAGKPPVKIKGTEIVRMIGGLWAVAEVKTTILEAPFTGILTLGFDTRKKRFVGTWIDSVSTHLLHYEGKVDASGKTLTLLTEGPAPGAPEKMAKFKETIEVKSKDHKVLVTSIQGDDGKWAAFMTINYRRLK